MTPDELKRLPKIELHCHLDGSLSPGFVSSRLGRPVADDELRVSPGCRNLAEYLEKFSLPLACLQDAEGFRGAGYDVLRTMSAENVRYAELRFAPLASAREDLPVAAIIEALLDGLEAGRRDFGVEYGVIVCAMRNDPEQDNLQMFRAARPFLGGGVVAGDLAGNEAAYPMEGYMDLFAEVGAMGMPCTVHAGECGRVENVRLALEAGAARIGHGIAMGGHPDVQELCRASGAGVEVCPISNRQTCAVPAGAPYPLRELLDAGLAVSINTDNRTVSGNSLVAELEFAQEALGISDKDVILMQENAIRTSFAPDSLKRRLADELLAFQKTLS